MRLIHYTDKEFDLEIKKYPQEEIHRNAKPTGLWISIQGPYDWKWWCEEEDFRIENLVVSYEVRLKDDAKILYLESEDSIFEMAKKYPFKSRLWDSGNRTFELNWAQIKQEYQGILIPQYLWACRLSQDSCWYYGWDCASGCLWDLNCIEEFKLIGEEK